MKKSIFALQDPETGLYLGHYYESRKFNYYRNCELCSAMFFESEDIAAYFLETNDIANGMIVRELALKEK